jgi:hypothetical protein
MREGLELTNERYDPSIRKVLDRVDWKFILPKLLYYAQNQCRKFYWLGDQHLHPQDLVQEAISLAYGCGKNGGYRNWNKEYYPDLPSFLKSVIKSIVNHKIEHIKEFPHDSIDSHEGKGEANLDVVDAQVSKSIYGGTSQCSPEGNILRVENEKVFSKRIMKLKSLGDGDEEMGLVMICFEDGISTPREIAETTGYDVKRVNNILKRIRRKATDIK